MEPILRGGRAEREFTEWPLFKDGRNTDVLATLKALEINGPAALDRYFNLRIDDEGVWRNGRPSFSSLSGYVRQVLREKLQAKWPRRLHTWLVELPQRKDRPGSNA
jgi:hypothetical protein